MALVDDEPVADRRAALAEAVKYGLLGDDGLLSLLESACPARVRPGCGRVASELLELVERCALAKRRLVLLDEHDTSGVRMALNLGHTLSNALEAATGYRLSAMARPSPTACARPSRIGMSMGVTPAALGGPRDPPARPARPRRPSRSTFPSDDVLDYIEADKKRRDGRSGGCSSAADGVMIRDDVPAPLVHEAVDVGRWPGRRDAARVASVSVTSAAAG